MYLRQYGVERNVASLLLWLLPVAASRNQAGGVLEKTAVCYSPGVPPYRVSSINPFDLLSLCVIMRFVSKEQVCHGCSNYGEIR